MGDLGWLGNRETPAVLSVLVFEDLAMAAYLPILTALLAGAGLLRGSLTFLVALSPGHCWRAPPSRSTVRSARRGHRAGAGDRLRRPSHRVMPRRAALQGT